MSAQHLIVRPPKPLVRFSGGTPNGYPDFVPLNPWGRGFPKPPRPEKPDLYQVVVKDKAKGNVEVPVGPKWGHEFAEMVRLAIANEIKLGRERRWTDPVVVKIQPDLGRPVFMGV